MRKKIFFVSFILALVFSCLKTSAQIYSPYYGVGETYGVIYYPYGYFQGQIYNGFANGMGYFVMMDGSIYYGMYSQGWCHGPGVFISRYYGYVAGCWNMGNFVGQCYGGNPYESPEVVRDVIEDVAVNKPEEENNNKVPDVDPDGYKVVPVDPNTPLGGKVLKGMRHP